MIKKDILDLLNRVAQGNTTPEQALDHLRQAPFLQTLDGVTLDNHRAFRTGMGEVVFGQGKTNPQLRAAVAGLSQDNQPVLATRLDESQGLFLAREIPLGYFYPEAGLFTVNAPLNLTPPYPDSGTVMVVTAGASDSRVGLEALGTTQFLGLDAGLVPDMGVAGLHRIQPHLPALAKAKLLIVAAGMEGALPSVLAGLLGKPIIAVPTSIGYGAAFNGLTPLLAMLNSCAPGVAVVNIDNGFGAATMAVKLLQTLQPGEGQ